MLSIIMTLSHMQQRRQEPATLTLLSAFFAASNGYLRGDYDAGSSRLSTTGLKTLLDIIRTHGINGDTFSESNDTSES